LRHFLFPIVPPLALFQSKCFSEFFKIISESSARAELSQKQKEISASWAQEPCTSISVCETASVPSVPDTDDDADGGGCDDDDGSGTDAGGGAGGSDGGCEYALSHREEGSCCIGPRRKGWGASKC
jgi:hypothetical protein